MFSRRGTQTRFDGLRLRITRDRTTWTLPARAPASAELAGDTTLRVTISGDPTTARHGVVSVVGINLLSGKARTGASVDLVYDPEKPTRASRPPTFAFALRTLALTSTGLALAALCLLLNLPL